MQPKIWNSPRIHTAWQASSFEQSNRAEKAHFPNDNCEDTPRNIK